MELDLSERDLLVGVEAVVQAAGSVGARAGGLEIQVDQGTRAAGGAEESVSSLRLRPPLQINNLLFFELSYRRLFFCIFGYNRIHARSPTCRLQHISLPQCEAAPFGFGLHALSLRCSKPPASRSVSQPSAACVL